MKKFLFCSVTILTLTVVANAQTKTPAKPVTKSVVPKPVMKNLLDSFSYAAGLNIAANMQQQGISQINPALVQRAIDDVFNNKTKLLSPEIANMKLQEQLQAFTEKKSAVEKAKGTAFLATNKSKAGVKTLPNGLQYEIITPGETNGMKPSAADTVVVHYVGTLIDGTEFDNSVRRGEPAEFPVGGVIRGWTEILQLMTKGAKWKVYIPSELGYGDRGAGHSIPPGATLIFEINLLDIKPAASK